MPASIDLVREDKRYYAATATPERVTFPELSYLTIPGAGAPEGPAHVVATQALFSVAYAVRQRAKAAGLVFTVPKLEGLWWVDGPGDPMLTPREEWQWRLLIRLPDAITAAEVAAGRDASTAKTPGLAPIEQVAFDRITEGACVQIMHVGPYAAEPETLTRLHAFIDAQGLRFAGRHHEISLSDPRRVSPDHMKTILRQPVGSA